MVAGGGLVLPVRAAVAGVGGSDLIHLHSAAAEWATQLRFLFSGWGHVWPELVAARDISTLVVLVSVSVRTRLVAVLTGA